MEHLWFMVFLSHISVVSLMCLISLDDIDTKIETRLWQIEVSPK